MISTFMLYLDTQVMSLALCTSQIKMIELAKETMVGALSNEGINARKKEGNPQPYLASMESVHQDNCTFEDIWTLKARTDHESMFHLMTTPQQCFVAFKCVNIISDKATPQQCLGAFKSVCNESGLLSNEWMEVCEKEGNHSPTLSPSNELQNGKAIDTNGNKMARFSATNDVQAKDC